MKYVYHVTKPRSLARVTEEGLKVNQSVSDKELSFWSSRYYGMRPIFVATAFATIPVYMIGNTIRIDADDLELVADLPSLVEMERKLKAQLLSEQRWRSRQCYRRTHRRG